MSELATRISTLNVHCFKDHSDQIPAVLNENFIDICGMQEVAGLLTMKRVLGDDWTCLFDGAYQSYGNGLAFRRGKFIVKKQMTHTLKEAPNKKTAFEVWLEDVHRPKMVYRLLVTHLDHKTEEYRLQQFKQLKSVIDGSELKDLPHMILGDLNALKRSDYTDAQWEGISVTRKKNNWEPPQTTLMDTFSKLGYKDVMENTTIVPTCRFDTRVDYILCSPHPSQFINRRAFVADTKGASDHKLVVVDF